MQKYLYFAGIMVVNISSCQLNLPVILFAYLVFCGFFILFSRCERSVLYRAGPKADGNCGGFRFRKVHHSDLEELLESGSNGKVRYREGRTVSPMEKTYMMALSPEYYAEEAAKKYGINLRGSGQQVNIRGAFLLSNK